MVYVGGPYVPVRDFEAREPGTVYRAVVETSGAGRMLVSVLPGAATAVVDGQGNALGYLLMEVDASGYPTRVLAPVAQRVEIVPPGEPSGQSPFAARAADAGRSKDVEVSWTAGDAIEVWMTFTEPVTVDLTDGTPTLGLVVGGRERTGDYSSGSDTDTLTFLYQLTKGDGTVTAVSVAANSLALNGATIRNDEGVDADLTHPGASIGEAPLTGFTLVDAAAHADETTLEDGATVVLEDLATGSWGFRADAAQDAEIGSVRLELSGAKTVARTENIAPWSLYGDTDRGVDGAALLAGSYVLRATVYANANLGGAVLQELAVSFTMTAPAPVEPALTVADAGAASGELSFRVTLAPASPAQVTVDWSTADGTATAGSDYTAASGTLTFQPGETEKTVAVAVLADGVAEDEETLTLTLTIPSGAVLEDAEATGTIADAGEPAPAVVPLTASFTNAPPTHTGSGMFTFRILFSEPVPISYKTLRDESLSATGGTVTRAKRVDGRSDLWEIEVEPAGNADVMVTLAGGRACDEAGAVCTQDGRRLSGTVSLTVAGPDMGTPAVPLTASFTDAPSEHTGSGTFTFRLLFSEPIAISYKTLRDESLSAAGGTVTRAKRVNGSNDLWEIAMAPASLADVRVVLAGDRACDEAGAVCTGDGRRLSATVALTVRGPAALTVRGPAALSVADARSEEGVDATLDFTVSLSRAASATVTVDYTTADRTATAGEDYTRAIGTLIFAAGETSKTVAVTVLDDAVDEGEETLTLTLSNASGAVIADGTATGTIENSDPLPKAWTARFGRTVGSHVVDALEERLGGASESYVQLGGQRLDSSPGATELASRLAPERDIWEIPTDPTGEDMTVRDLLLGSAFRLVSNPASRPGQAGDEATYPRLSVWGRVATSSFDGEEDRLSLGGTVTTATLGVDGVWKRWLTGLLLAYSDGDGSFTQAEAPGGDLASTLTSIHPYVGYTLSDRVKVWGMVGYGSGALQLRLAERSATDTDLTMTMGALGVRGALLAPSQASGLELTVRSDVLWLRMDTAAVEGMVVATEADVSRLRLVLEGSRPISLASGGSLTPALEVGLRHDGGDAETGSGVEVGGRIRYASAWGLSIEASVRGLLAHEAADYQEWGASGALRLDPGQKGRGLSASIMPTWGSASSGVSRLWGQPDAAGLAVDNALAAAAGRLDAELGYGLAALNGQGLLTPYARVALSEGDSQAWHLGARLALASSLNFSLEASRRQRDGDVAAHEIALRATLGW